MRKQTKLVAVLSTAALLAIGASMTSFAATGWAEEDGTWVYYNRDGERATEQWKKSGNNWYYLDGNGEMAIDQLIEDDNNYYYVDINGVMASNQWVAIENEDAGNDDEPDQNWYYFQANGKALTNGDNNKVSLKTINGKKYAFDEDGKMLWGWVKADDATHIDNSDGDAFKDGDYYFGGSDDGAMTVGWIQLDVTYEEATQDDYKFIGAAFNDDEDQSRWFYFKSNGKKVVADDGETKDKTINGRKYAFDDKGAMIAEWSIDMDDARTALGTDLDAASVGEASWNQADRASNGAGSVATGTNYVATSGILGGSGKYAKYSQAWKYFSDVEDGARISKGWFKVVAAENLNSEKYDDDEDAWYYADGSGNIYAGEFKTINGKKYAFRNDGRMIDGLKFIYNEKDADNLIVAADDDGSYPFDDEDAFLDSATKYYEQEGFKAYYFGGGDDGAMRTGKTTVSIDGENKNFYFEKSGANKGAGLTGEKDDKLYMAGMLLQAGSDEKYQVVEKITHNASPANATDKKYTTYQKLDDAEAFMDRLKDFGLATVSDALKDKSGTDGVTVGGSVNKKAQDLKEAYNIVGFDGTLKNPADKYEYILINTSGKVIDKKGKNKDGNDYYYITDNKGIITGLYVED